VRAIDKSHESQRLCPSFPCQGGAQQANDEARDAATISDVAFAIGGAGVLGAIGFSLLGSSSSTSTTGSAPPRGSHPTIAGAIVGWQGRW
jgi:hypothetical protein